MALTRDVVALEGLHERLGDAIAFRAFDRREAGFEVQCDRDVERLGGRIDRAVVCEPLDRMGCTNRPEAAPDALDHEVTDHLAGDACGGSAPADDLAIMAVECEGDAHDLAVAGLPAALEALIEDAIRGDPFGRSPATARRLVQWYQRIAAALVG
jgi:hypothetical protein